MTEKLEGDKFRAKAKLVYRLVCMGIMIGVVGVAVLGWLSGGWIGLGIASIIGLVGGFAVLTTAVMFFAMTQDGA
ncbi:hypothetical protein [Zavarzinella formosa]|uniref:hypothetical protein n=1 Tax=Zavarzinella formosa TaxID=360055 RepID=UPI0002E3C5AB|nr:hypothetical protein [Zavarzinella formosa]